uniref:Uncharacterized protein n=1 Tax=Hanusia phi TaxID=3032 RepID=A0A7S0HSD5_9CRYP|mmetsp:Transcript_31265/g.70380  ORF Transcript_31265/g.70380 Transcript_31265/m.70380 type:complete len:187 (+) Transcript_31265:21-581(+)
MVEDAPQQEQEVDHLSASGERNQKDDIYEGNMSPLAGGKDARMSTRTLGFVGAAPSSLAGLARGKSYFIDPYTPFTPRPDTLSTRSQITGPPLASYRSNHWITQTSIAYRPKRLQNHRIPRTPPETKRGFPAAPFPRPSFDDGRPKFIVGPNGHLLEKYKKAGRTAFPAVEEVGRASWNFSKMGYV